MRFSICFWIVLLALVAPLWAQDGPVQMTPEFCFTFPLTANGKDVTVKYPVLINPTAILKPGVVLRTMYVLSYTPEGSSDLALAHKGDMEEAYSRPTLNSDEEAKMPPELAHELEGYRRTIWQVPNNFVLAMAQYPTDSMHLIYKASGSDKGSIFSRTEDSGLYDERFSFFDGLMVGLPGGKVTVLAVEKGSKAEGAGLKAGDEIISVGGTPLNNDLGTFSAAYAAAKKAAKDNEVSTYPMTIQSGGTERVIKIAMPPTIKSSLMDGF